MATRGKQIFVGKDDHESFLYWLERVCTSRGWRVHAWVLMGNHFHLLLETSCVYEPAREPDAQRPEGHKATEEARTST